MMSKPFDSLRSGALQPGKFHCKPPGLLQVNLAYIEKAEAWVQIGSGMSFCVQADTAEVLSDFFAELAKQLRTI